MSSVLRLNGDLAGAEALLEQSSGAEYQDARCGSSEHGRQPARPRADRGKPGRFPRRRIRPPAGARPAAEGARGQPPGHCRDAQQPRADAPRAAALRRGGRRAQEALNITRTAFGSDHQLVAIYTINLASIQLARNELSAAERLLREGLRVRSARRGSFRVRRRTVREDDWSLGATRSLLGACLLAERRYPEAEDMLLDARRQLEALPASGGAEMKVAIARLIELYVAWADPTRPPRSARSSDPDVRRPPSAISTAASASPGKTLVPPDAAGVSSVIEFQITRPEMRTSTATRASSRSSIWFAA